MKNYVDKDKLQEYTTKLTAKNKTIFATKAEVGSPLKASTVAEMTDQNRVYVYVGSESGYTSGNWYYYDGSAWTSGGIYNSAAIQTDSTLSIAGKAADAKAVGDALANVEIEVDATLTQAGMAADAKAAGDAIGDLKSASNDYDEYIIGIPNLMPEITNDYYLNDSGTPTAQSGFYYTDYIPVTPGVKYEIKYVGGTSSNPLRIHGYDSSKVWQEMILKYTTGGGGDIVLSKIVTIPEGIYYIRISTYGNKPLKAIYVYGENNLSGRIADKMDSRIFENIDFSEYEDGYVKTDGSTVESGNWKHKIIENAIIGTVVTATVYCSNSLHAIMLFDSDDNYIGGAPIQSSGSHTFTYTLPASGTVVINFSSSYSASGTTLLEYDIDAINEKIASLEKELDIPYMVMLHKIGICGDSLSSGEIYDGSTVRDCYDFSWLSNICRTIDAEYVHYSKGGLTTKAWWNDSNGYKTALANETEKPQAYYVAFGTNDKNQSAYPIGTISDTAGTDSFVGYMRSIIEYIHTEQPSAVIFLVTTYNDSEASTPYNTIIGQISELYSYCFFIDYASNAEVMTTQNDMYVENSHFSTIGYVRVANTIKKLTEKAIKDNLAWFKHFGLSNT